MNLQISLSGTSLFKRNIFSLPYPTGPLWATLVNIIFRSSSASARQAGPYSFSASLSTHIKNFRWNSAIKWVGTEILTQGGKCSSSSDFPVEVRLSSDSLKNYFHVKESKEHSFMKVNYLEIKKASHVFDLEDI